jgi:hypothetical protein
MKSTSVVLCALVLILHAGSAMAQEWSAEQKEVIAQIKACWDANNRAHQEKNFDLFTAACPCEKDGYWWVTSEGAPRQFMNLDARLTTEGLYWGIKRANWLDLRPLSIKIDGDLALVYFYAIWIFEDYRGGITQTEQKHFEVYRKKSGRWTFLGGMTAL